MVIRNIAETPGPALTRSRPVNLYCADFRARAREAEPSDALRQQTDPRSERPAGAACWPPSPIPF